MKYLVAERIKSNPKLWFMTLKYIHLFPFLLPHEKSYLGLKRLHLAKDDLILDVGANNGLSALGFRSLGIDSRILSIEANSDHAAALARLKSRIRDFEFMIVGAGERAVETDLYVPIYRNMPLHGLSSMFLDYAKKAIERDFPPSVVAQVTYARRKTKTITIDSLNLDPAFIKVDVEGFDHSVLLGSEATIERCHPYLLIEFTPGWFDRIEGFLAQRDYAFFVFEPESDTFHSFESSRAERSWSESGLQVNVYCIPKTKLGVIAQETQ